MAYIDMGKGFARNYGANPLDASSVHASKSAFESYVTTNPIAYVGQLCSFIDESDSNKVKIVKIISLSGVASSRYEELGAGVVSLSSITNIPSGTVFYRKTAGTGSAETQTLATLKADLGLTGTNGGDETTSSIKTKLGQASTGNEGYLTATDWNTFNGKQNALGFTPENVSNKDVSNGYAGLTLFKLNLRNVANSFTSFLTNSATAVRTWTMPDKDGTVAMLSDIPATPNASQISIADAGSKITATNVEDALQEIKTAVDLNTAKVTNATHTGEVTGSTALTITAKAVTLAKMADVATGTVFYRKTAATGVPEVQTLATLKADLGLTGSNNGDETTATLGTKIAGASDSSSADADYIPITDSTASNIVRKLTWANLKSRMLTYIVGRYTTRERFTGLTTNTVTLANTPIVGTEMIFLNGILQDADASNDYTISGKTITFTFNLIITDKVLVSYWR